MKHLFFLIFTIAFSTSVNGQQNKIDIGIEGSPSLIFLYGNAILQKYHHPSIGFSGAFSFQYNFPKIFSIRTSFGFERKGSKYKNTFYFTDISGKIIDSEKYIVDQRFDYLTLPLLLRASFGNKIKWFINGGFFVGYLFKQTNKPGPSKYFPSKMYDNTMDFNRIDMGFTGGLGFSIPIKSNISISFEARNNLGIYNLSNTAATKKGMIKTNSTNLLISLAYKFASRQADTK